MSKGSKAPSTQTVSQTNNPPAFALPYVEKLAKQAYDLGNYQNPQRGVYQSQIDSIDTQLKNLTATPANVSEEYLRKYGNPTAQNSSLIQQLTQQRGDLLNQMNTLPATVDPASKLFPGSYNVDPSQTSNDALSMLEQYGRNPSQLETSSTAYANSVLNGDYLNGNPYIDQVANRAARSLQTQYKDAVASSGLDAAGLGRYGSGLYQKAIGNKQDALGQSLTDLNGGIYYNNYNDERTRQQAMSALAPTINQQSLDRANILAGVGATRDNLAQQKRDEEIARFEYSRDYPSKQLDDTIARIMQLSGNYSSGTTIGPGQQQQRTGGLGSAISGGIGGLSIGTTLAGGMGAGAGLAAVPGLGWAGLGLGALGGLLG